MLDGKDLGCISDLFFTAVDVDSSQRETQVCIVDGHRRTFF